MLRLLVSLALLVVVSSVSKKDTKHFLSKLKTLKGHKGHIKRRASAEECTVSSVNDDFVPYFYESSGDFSNCWMGMNACHSDEALYDLLVGVTKDQEEDDAVTRYWTMCNTYHASPDHCFSPFLKWLGPEDTSADPPWVWKKSRALCWMFDNTGGDHFDAFMIKFNDLSDYDRKKIYNGLGPHYIAGALMISKLRRWINGKTEPARVLGRALTELSEWEVLGDLGIDKAIEGYGQVTEAAADAIVRIFSGTCERGSGTMGFPTCCTMVNMELNGACDDFFDAYNREKDACS
jgi:hypothetical protein